MAHFVKVGRRYINLDKVLWVVPGGSIRGGVFVHFGGSRNNDRLELNFKDARQLLAHLERNRQPHAAETLDEDPDV